MSSEIDQASNGGLGLAFILSEMRDLRKGMEFRDENLRASVDGVRDSVNDLSAKVDRSQGDVDAVRVDMESLKDDMHSVRTDVDEIMDERKIEKVKKGSAWSGPVGVIKIITLIGGLAAALLAIINFGPAALALFVPSP